MEAVCERKKRIYSYVNIYGRGNLHKLGMYPVHAGWEPVHMISAQPHEFSFLLPCANKQLPTNKKTTTRNQMPLHYPPRVNCNSKSISLSLLRRVSFAMCYKKTHCLYGPMTLVSFCHRKEKILPVKRGQRPSNGAFGHALHTNKKNDPLRLSGENESGPVTATGKRTVKERFAWDILVF